MIKDLKVVYTPLHGTGNEPVQKVLEDLGFTNVYVVPEQELPNGNFPTVDYPNPEDVKAFDLALKLAEKVDVSIVNLSNLKTGKVKAVRFSTLNAICKVLNCQPGDILEYVEDDEE